MKTQIILLSAIVLLICSPGKCQDKKVALGLSLSPSLNWFKAESSQMESTGSIPSFTYGLISDFRFGENYAFSTGLFINNGGGKLKQTYEVDSVMNSTENRVRIQSIRLPLTLRMMTKEIGYLRYYGQFGFNTDYVIAATTDVKVNGGLEVERNIREDITPFNLSLNVGIGFIYNISGTTNFMVGLSFNNGFLDVFESKSPDGMELNGRANQFALNLAVLF